MTILKWNGYCDLALNFCTGCSNQLPCRATCWARKMSTRLAAISERGTAAGSNPYQAGLPYARQLRRRGDPFWPALHLDVMARVDKKLAGMKKPRRVALNFMSDIGSDGAWDVYGEDGGSSQVWPGAAVQVVVRQFCERHPRHTFLILTKRPEALLGSWPANVHVGVSASTAAEARERLGHLARIECGLRWVSLEPWDDACEPVKTGFTSSGFSAMFSTFNLGWLVIGGWSGKKPLRPEVVASAQSIVQACKRFHVPVFVKDNLRDTHEACLSDASFRAAWSGVSMEEEWPQEIPGMDGVR